MLTLFQKNPMRPANWRWQRAQQLATGKRRPNRRLDDAMIYQLACMYQELKRLQEGDEIAYLRIHDQSQALYELCMLQRLDEPFRWEIEARLLAKQSDEEIADKSDYLPETIGLYHDVFFDVRSRLKRPSFIIHGVMGTSIHYGLNAREFDLLWKLYGYTLGPLALDMLMSMRPFAFPGTYEASEYDIRDQIKYNQMLSTLITSRTTAINGFTQQAIMECWFRSVELERSSGTEAKDGILQNISTALNHVTWSVGSQLKHRNEDANHQLRLVRQTGVEPREADLLRLGIDPDYKISVPDVSFPEAANAQTASPPAE